MHTQTQHAFSRASHCGLLLSKVVVVSCTALRCGVFSCLAPRLLLPTPTKHTNLDVLVPPSCGYVAIWVKVY